MEVLVHVRVSPFLVVTDRLGILMLALRFPSPVHVHKQIVTFHHYRRQPGLHLFILLFSRCRTAAQHSGARRTISCGRALLCGSSMEQNYAQRPTRSLLSAMKLHVERDKWRPAQPSLDAGQE